MLKSYVWSLIFHLLFNGKLADDSRKSMRFGLWDCKTYARKNHVFIKSKWNMMGQCHQPILKHAKSKLSLEQMADNI